MQSLSLIWGLFGFLLRYGCALLWLCALLFLLGCDDRQDHIHIDLQNDEQAWVNDHFSNYLTPINYRVQSPVHIASESINKIPCPKLLPLSANNTSMMYHDRMLSDSCDYYVYLKAGQSFSLSLSHRSIKASAISPYHHDFADGAMRVWQTGRHIIRLKRHYHFGNNDKSISYVLRLEVKTSTIPSAN